MKRLIVLLYIFSAALCLVRAQEAKTCFINMPDSISSLFTSVNRADFVDFLESKMKAEVSNRLGGKSEMTRLTADYIRLQTTPRSEWQMKLLPVNDSTKIICTVSTVSAPVADSHIRFYTSDWQELPLADCLPALPVKADFLPSLPDTVSYGVRDAYRQADLFFLKADLSEQDATLTFTFTTPDLMEKEAAEKLKPFVRRPLTYVWKEGRFLPAGE